LEVSAPTANGRASIPLATQPSAARFPVHLGGKIKRKEITAFTRELGALLAAAIPIPQALEGLGEEEDNPALRAAVLKIADSVRKGASLSAALEEHPKSFSKLYISMVKVGEEAGVLPTVMADLAQLLEHEDEVRGEVMAAVAYPAFVLVFGIFTVAILLTVVLPRLFGMLQEMLNVLPLPTLILLRVSSILHQYWPWLLLGIAGIIAVLRWYFRTPRGAVAWDRAKLKLPVMGAGFSRGSLKPLLAHVGHVGQKRCLPLAGVENSREHDWESGVGQANRSSGGRNARWGFAGRTFAQAGYFSKDCHTNDQCGRRDRQAR